MSKALQQTVTRILKKQGKPVILTWGGSGDAKGKGKTANIAVTEKALAAMTSRQNRFGERITYFIFGPTKRGIMGATFVFNSQTYTITSALELRPNDVLVATEADVK